MNYLSPVFSVLNNLSPVLGVVVGGRGHSAPFATNATGAERPRPATRGGGWEEVWGGRGVEAGWSPPW